MNKTSIWYRTVYRAFNGECGRFQPSALCQINSLCFLNRVANAPDSKIVKLVFEELRRLGDQGFQTWINKACELANSWGIESNMITCSDKDEFEIHCKQIVMNKFINVWQQDLIAQTKPLLRTQTKPLLRTYSLFKNDFFTEHHLELITDFRYRAAITKLRCSSHALEIERGRYQNPKVPRDPRLCLTCKVVEDENHFVQNAASIKRSEGVCTPKYRAKLHISLHCLMMTNLCIYSLIMIPKSLLGLENLFIIRL